MKTSTARDIAIGIACLLAGVGLSAMLLSPSGGAGHEQHGWREQGRASGSGAPVVAEGGAGKSDAVGSHPPMDSQRVLAFARKLEAIEGSPARTKAVLDWFESFGEEDFAPFMQLLFGIMDGEENELLGDGDAEVMESMIEWVFGEQEIVGAYFCECWANVAPDSLIGALGWLPPENAVSMGTYALPYLWGHDPEGGQRALDDLRRRCPEEFEEEFDEDEFVHQLYQVSEVGALRWMAENGSDEPYIDDLLENGVSDPHGVIGELFTWSPKDVRDEALGSLLDYYSTSDPGMALELLRTHASEFDEDLREEVDEWAADLAASQWVLEDPQSRLDLESEEYDGRDLLEKWLLRDHESALAWVTSQGGEAAASEEFARIVAENLDELPFDFAIRFASPSEMPNWAPSLSDEQLQSLIMKSPELGIRELYRRDPQAALALAAEGEGDERFLALAEAIEDSDARGGLLAELSPESRLELGDQLFGAWADDDPLQAYEVTAEYPENTASVVNQWLRFEDAEQVYAAVGARFDENPDVQNAIIDAWAARDPWVAGETLLADGYGDGVARLIARWVGSDSIEASRFIRENLEPGGQRDQAVRDLALGIAKRDLDAAREWAGTIGEEALRDEVLDELDRPGG